MAISGLIIETSQSCKVSTIHQAKGPHGLPITVLPVRDSAISSSVMNIKFFWWGVRCLQSFNKKSLYGHIYIDIHW